jgi:hypothetical protein
MFKNLLSSSSDPDENPVVIVTLLSLRFCPPRAGDTSSAILTSYLQSFRLTRGRMFGFEFDMAKWPRVRATADKPTLEHKQEHAGLMNRSTPA